MCGACCWVECAVGHQKYIDFSKTQDAVHDHAPEDQDAGQEAKTPRNPLNFKAGDSEEEEEEQEVSSVLPLHVIQASLMLPLKEVEELRHPNYSQKVIRILGKRYVGGQKELRSYYISIENTDDYADLLKVLKERSEPNAYKDNTAETYEDSEDNDFDDEENDHVHLQMQPMTDSLPIG